MHGGVLVALWPDATGTDVPPGVMVHRAMARAAPDVTATIAVSPAQATEYGDAYRIAKGALEIAVRAGRTDSVVGLEDLGVVGLLLQLDDPAKLLAYATRTLGPLLEYDAAHRTDLVSTLHTHFVCKQDRNVTAQRLMIHPNTVAQRLRRIERLCGVDLGDPAATVQFSSASWCSTSPRSMSGGCSGQRDTQLLGEHLDHVLHGDLVASDDHVVVLAVPNALAALRQHREILVAHRGVHAS